MRWPSRRARRRRARIRTTRGGAVCGDRPAIARAVFAYLTTLRQPIDVTQSSGPTSRVRRGDLAVLNRAVGSTNRDLSTWWLGAGADDCSSPASADEAFQWIVPGWWAKWRVPGINLSRDQRAACCFSVALENPPGALAPQERVAGRRGRGDRHTIAATALVIAGAPASVHAGVIGRDVESGLHVRGTARSGCWPGRESRHELVAHRPSTDDAPVGTRSRPVIPQRGP
jgi:hypothetical protein